MAKCTFTTIRISLIGKVCGHTYGIGLRTSLQWCKEVGINDGVSKRWKRYFRDNGQMATARITNLRLFMWESKIQ